MTGKRKLANLEAIEIRTPARLLIIPDTDVIGTRLGEFVFEERLVIELFENLAVVRENAEDWNQRGAELHAAVLERKLLAGFNVDLVEVEIAGLRDRARENRRQVRIEGVLGRIVGLFIGAFAVVGLDQETPLRTRAERRKQAELDRTDFGFRIDVQFDRHLIARRQRAEIDRRRRTVRAEADIREIGQLLHAQDAALHSRFAEVNRAGFGEI